MNNITSEMGKRKGVRSIMCIDDTKTPKKAYLGLEKPEASKNEQLNKELCAMDKELVEMREKLMDYRVEMTILGIELGTRMDSAELRESMAKVQPVLVNCSKVLGGLDDNSDEKFNQNRSK